jgi:hypothetical protein
MNDMQVMLDAIKASNADLAKEITKEIKADIDNVRRVLDQYESRCQNQYKEVKNDISMLRDENVELRKKIEAQEIGKRKNNLIIFDIIEHDNEKTERVVRELCSELNVTLGPDGVMEAYRLGRNKGSRPILLKLTSFEKKKDILYQNKLQNKKFAIMPDLTQNERENRKELKPYQDKARKDGRHAFIRGDQLIIDGQAFTINDLINDLVSGNTAEGERMQLDSNTSTEDWPALAPSPTRERNQTYAEATRVATTSKPHTRQSTTAPTAPPTTSVRGSHVTPDKNAAGPSTRNGGGNTEKIHPVLAKYKSALNSQLQQTKRKQKNDNVGESAKRIILTEA